MNEIENEEPLDRRRERFLRDFFENSELYTFGIITQTGYNELKNKLQKVADTNEKRLHRWLIFGLLGFTIIGLTCTGALGGFGMLLGRQAKVGQTIQQQRREAIGDNCRDQNHRHDRTLGRLAKAEKNAEKKAKTRKRKMQIRNRAEVSIGLIDTLAPHQNCKAVVRRATQ